MTDEPYVPSEDAMKTVAEIKADTLNEYADELEEEHESFVPFDALSAGIDVEKSAVIRKLRERAEKIMKEANG